MLDLNELAKQSQEIAKKRAKHGLGADTTTCLKHCSGEVCEALQAFNDWQVDLRFANVSMGVTDPDWQHDYKKEYAGELADIIVCALIAAANSNVDIEKALTDCVEKNRKRAEGTGDKY